MGSEMCIRDRWVTADNVYGSQSGVHNNVVNLGNDPFGPTHTDLPGNSMGIYFSMGGMTTVTGQEYGNGIYEYRSDRGSTYAPWGKAFSKWIYRSGSSHTGWAYGTNFNRNTDKSGNYDNEPADNTFGGLGYAKAVSYTHLTLPTICSV